MWYAANLAHADDDASHFGIAAERGATDWHKLVDGRQDYIGMINRTVIWAAGRAPNTGSLELCNAGVATRANGIVPTDGYQNINVEGIYAIGDTTGRTPLTPVAIAAGRRLADRLFGGKPESRVDYCNIPNVVFFHPRSPLSAFPNSRHVKSSTRSPSTRPTSHPCVTRCPNTA